MLVIEWLMQWVKISNRRQCCRLSMKYNPMMWTYRRAHDDVMLFALLALCVSEIHRSVDGGFPSQRASVHMLFWCVMICHRLRSGFINLKMTCLKQNNVCQICIMHNNFSGTETRIFGAKWVNAMSANALDPCVARTSAAMVLNIQDKWIIFYEEVLKRPPPPQCLEVIEMRIYVYVS